VEERETQEGRTPQETHTHTEGMAPQGTHHRRGGPHRGPTQNTHRQHGFATSSVEFSYHADRRPCLHLSSALGLTRFCQTKESHAIYLSMYLAVYLSIYIYTYTSISYRSINIYTYYLASSRLSSGSLRQRASY